METREESDLAVLRLFGREPTAEDWRWVGRWAYASAWLAEDRGTARSLVRARLVGAAALGTGAALGAGRGDADRFTLVSAIARLQEAFEEGRGAFGAVAERMVDEAAGQLVADGAALRAATTRERAAFAPRFGIEGFAAAMLDVGSERHVLMREAARGLDEALLEARDPCPALRTLRLFLHATLAMEPRDASAGLEAAPAVSGGDPVSCLSLWLAADLALVARRSAAYEAAWVAASRMSGDGLSRTVAGLASGAMLAKGAVDAMREEPSSLLFSLAMTTAPEHASALLDGAVRAQAAGRVEAGQEAARWASQAGRVEEMEGKLGLAIPSSPEIREGFREYESCGGLDLFTAWSVRHRAREARASLRDAMERTVAGETARRREAVRRAKASLERSRDLYEAAIEEARRRMDGGEGTRPLDDGAEESAQRGCVFGFGSGCSVLATYAVVGAVVGTGGVVGRIAPLVVGIAAVPVAAAILLQMAVAIRKALAEAEAGRRRSAATAEFERVRAAAERAHGARLASVREALQTAEASLAELEGRLGQGLKQAA